ncbi:hypothetical protein Dda_3563 [Drechslerella dactyloides]|uniref:Glycosyltransferase 2-like domain-containing protein n=1 Tax=Drechslerella dactyloides TaxID=74499 RepID=A0AAD6NJX3_DREDA|nr:hypothetical protein Dda_3563 [Drechslerella dactyloides]
MALSDTVDVSTSPYTSSSALSSIPSIEYRRPISTSSLAERTSLEHAQLIASHIHEKFYASQWTLPGPDAIPSVCVRTKEGEYAVEPSPPDMKVLDAVQKLDVKVAFLMRSKITDCVFRTIADEDDELIFPREGVQVQIFNSLDEVIDSTERSVRRFQYICFLRREQAVLLWHDHTRSIFGHADHMNTKMMSLGHILFDAQYHLRFTCITCIVSSSKDRKLWLIDHNQRDSVYTGVAVSIMTILLFGGSLRIIVTEAAVDEFYLRYLLAISIPFSGALALMPVYKESLAFVLGPTIESLKKAISNYELHGGTANLFVNDDGMQIIDPVLAQERRQYYRDHGIGWVARPGNGQNGYLRAGKFKKASNMNFCLEISNKTEDMLLDLIQTREEVGQSLTCTDEQELYETALERVIMEDKRAWAAGNIRVGEIILIVDSDTRVPADCLIYGAAEMFLNPEVAIIQHSAGVMQVVGDYFENGITYFTNLIYSSIRFVCGSGDIAPFVGHNAFLRWQAVQSVAYRADGREYYWSESHVSEDFDLALRLQVAGNIVRLATYHGLEGFQEGVSLTIYDELARWEKYAYGCNELVLNPIHTWLWRGPFSRLFIMFLTSNIQLCSKISVLGYILSYYAIAIGFPFAIINYALLGWCNGFFDSFYLDGWRVFLSLIAVFSFLGNLSLAVLRYRLCEKSLMGALMENFKWMPMFVVFFSGLSFHVNTAILAHLFSIDMTWGATSKEKTDSNFWIEVPRILKTFKWMYLIVGTLAGCMVYCGIFAPPDWRVTEFTAIVPLATMIAGHLLLPFALNPALMVFNY